MDDELMRMYFVPFTDRYAWLFFLSVFLKNLKFKLKKFNY